MFNTKEIQFTNTTLGNAGNDNDKSGGPVMSGKHVDLTYLFKQAKGNPELIKKMTSLYLKQTPELLDTIIKGTEEKNWPEVNTAVHKMIPSFWLMGIDPSLALIAKTIQEYSSKGANA